MSQAEDLLNIVAEAIPAHNHPVPDADAYYTINPITRKIESDKSNKNVIMQHDHNSERFTFELPRYVDGHDILQCNSVTVNVDNIEIIEVDGVPSETGNVNSDAPMMTDLRINPLDPEKVISSWLITRNSTQLPGILKFNIEYKCVDSNGKTVYEWSTDDYDEIEIRARKKNTEAVALEHSDYYEQLHTRFVETTNTALQDIHNIVDGTFLGKSDTVTIYDNPEDRIVVNANTSSGQAQFTRISDTVLSIDDWISVDEVYFTVYRNEEYKVYYLEQDTLLCPISGVIFDGTHHDFIIVSQDTVGEKIVAYPSISPNEWGYFDITVPEPGIYVRTDPTDFVISLTIPGFNGFPIKINPELLTDIVTIEHDPSTVTWDGNEEGRLVVQPVTADHDYIKMVHVSDVAPMLADVVGKTCIFAELDQNGAIYEIECRYRDEDESNRIEEACPGVMNVQATSVISVQEEAVGKTITIEGFDHIEFIFPKAGLYFYSDDAGTSTRSFTIPGYTGFTELKLKPEVLPDNLLTFDSQTLTEEQKAQVRENIGATAVDLGIGTLDVTNDGNGNITLANVPTTDDDYIIEQGRSSNWEYRKWANGIAECWRTVTATVKTTDWKDSGMMSFPLLSDFGLFWTKEMVAGKDIQFTYPFAFASRPVETVNMTNGTAWFPLQLISTTGKHLDRTDSYRLCTYKVPEQNIEVTISFHVIGKWK